MPVLLDRPPARIARATHPQLTPQPSAATFHTGSRQAPGFRNPTASDEPDPRQERPSARTHAQPDTRLRPLLLIDEAQEVLHSVLTELRLLASTEFDSRAILSVVLAGDNRLLAKLRSEELQPVASRIRQRLVMAAAEPRELETLLNHLLEQAGNPALMTAGLKDALCAHAAGNPRTLCIMADSLLVAAAEQDREILDEKLFMEIWGEPVPRGRQRVTRRAVAERRSRAAA